MTATNEKIDQLLDQVRQQHGFLEMFARSWSDDYRSGGGAIFCGKGCRNCCSLPVHTGFIEALAVARCLGAGEARGVEAYAVRLKERLREVDDLPGYLRLHRKEIGFCPLLNEEGACSVYPARPLTCRALISTREGSWCGINLAEVPPAEGQAFIAGLDRKVVAFPTHYVAVLQETGKELEDAGAKRMHELFGFSLYGNLGVLVHLISAHGLAEKCLKGAAEAAGAIAVAGFDHPLLVTMSREE